MSVTLSPVGGAGAQFFDNNGNPLSGGKLYTYAAGTTTPVSTYTSAAGSTLHTNPIVLDSAGRVPGSSEIWLTDGVIYKFLLKTNVDVTLATWDNITGVNSNFVNFTAESEYQTATAGQTVFTLTTMTYSPGTGNLTVYVDGVNQYLGTSYVETDGVTVTFTAGLHVGALVKFTTAVETTGNATDASVVTYTPAGTGAVTTTVQAKLRETVSVKDFGAVGDGVTDDTAAFNALDAYLATVNYPIGISIPDGVYLVNPLATTNPLGDPTACLFRVYSNGSRVTGPGQIKINSSVNYTAGFSAGDEKYWSVIQLDADDCTVEGLRFDGNGTNTAQGYSPSIVNIRWQLAASFGSSGNHRAGNKIIFCQGIDFGGQAVAFQYQDAALIGWNRFNNHSGIGVSVGSDAKILGNSLRTCYDAPIYLNPITGGKVLGNYISGTTNGSGIDIVGAVDTEVANNYVQDAFGSGIYVTYSGQQLVGCDRVHIHHNTFKSNAGYTSTPVVGEIKIGRDSNTPNSANNVLVENNIIIMDGSATATAGRPLITNYGVNNLVFRNNMIYGTANANNTFATIQQGVAGLEISGNRWLGSSTRQLISIVAGAVNTNFRVYANDLIGFDPAGTLLPNGGVLQDDGSVVFSIQRNIPASATTVLTATFLSGGFNHIMVDVVAVQEGDARGVAQNKITAKGYNAVSPTVLANTSEVALGSNPPVVTTSLSSGVLTVQLASVGATADTNLAVRVRCKLSAFNLVFA